LDAEAAELTRTDLDAAEQLWLRAIELFAEARDEARRQAALGRLGLLHCAAGAHAEGLAEIEASVAALVGLGDEPAAARALTRQAIGHRVADDLPAGLRALERAAALAAGSGDALLVASIALDRADFTAAQGGAHFVDAAFLATQAVSLYQTVGPCGGRYRAHYLAGRLLAATGELERAFGEFDAAARTDDQGLRGDALHYRGRIALDLDRPQEAYRALSDSVADLLAAGSPVAYARVNLAAAALAADHPADAADAAEDAAPELDALGDVEEAARARYLLARAHRALGTPDRALELLDTVTEHCVAQENPAGAGQMCTLSGEILDDLDRDALAAQAFTRAAEFYQDASLAEPELRTRRRAALSWRWAGATDSSLTALAAAEEVATELPSDDPHVAWELALLRYDAARILAAAGKLGDAVDRLDGAAERFRLMDAPVEAAMTDALHGRLLADLGRPTDAEKLLTEALAALPDNLTRPREELESLLADIRP
jgi:tetratricopeptide (TPR) repeat protein